MFAFDMAQSRKKIERMTTWPNQRAAANGLSAVRSSVAGNRERTVRSTAAAEAVAELEVMSFCVPLFNEAVMRCQTTKDQERWATNSKRRYGRTKKYNAQITWKKAQRGDGGAQKNRRGRGAPAVRWS